MAYADLLLTSCCTYRNMQFMKRAILKAKRQDLVDLATLYDGPSDDSAEELADLPATPTAQVPAHIPPQTYRLLGEFDHRPGEDAWAYLDRIAPMLLKELIAMATAPISVINPKVKLEALKELIQRPMPARQVYDIRTPPAGSEFDRMTDAQVAEYVTKQISSMQSEEHASPSPTAEDQSDKTNT